MRHGREGDRPASLLLIVIAVSALAAGCAEPVEEAAETFRECMETAGFTLQGWGAGISEQGIGVQYDLAEPRQEMAASRTAQVCVTATSQRVGRLVFLDQD